MNRHTVVVTGSECTGKTTLARELGEWWDAPVSQEFARTYVGLKAAPPDATDVEPIARGQLAAEDAAARLATRLVVLDTDLVSTVVYARHYYGNAPAWVVEAARARLADLYLLLHPDVPWVADGLLRDRPALRAEIHAEFRETLEGWGARVVHVTGDWEARRRAAIQAVARLLGHGDGNGVRHA